MTPNFLSAIASFNCNVKIKHTFPLAVASFNQNIMSNIRYKRERYCRTKGNMGILTRKFQRKFVDSIFPFKLFFLRLFRRFRLCFFGESGHSTTNYDLG